MRVDAHRVTVGGKQTYGCVNMSDFLEKLVAKLEPNPTSLKNFRRMYSPKGVHEADPKGPLETSVLYNRVQVTGRQRRCHITHRYNERTTLGQQCCLGYA